MKFYLNSSIIVYNKGMEECVDLGLTKHIGLSNFNSKQIARILDTCRIKPVNNQVRPWTNYSSIKSTSILQFFLHSVKFSSKELQRWVIFLFFLQIESHPYLNNHKIIKFCKENGITCTAYSPLAGFNPKLR